MKRFRVAIAYEEGFGFDVEAETAEEAEEKALEQVSYFAGVEMEGFELDTVHRDYFVACTDEIN